MLDENKNLIFLLSLPRSGSTLLQRILSRHDAIRTESEPWVMLHPLYALREKGFSAEYNEDLAYKALRIFLSSMDSGEDVYYEGLRRMLKHIYQSAMKDADEKYFLDKTPRYYEIVPEIHRVFPSAKFIFLIRNPLAVVNSRIDLLGKNLKALKPYGRDFLTGPVRLLEGIERIGGSSVVIKYEDLVDNPDSEVKRLCQYLEIEYDADMLNYNDGQKKWQYGDQETVYTNSRPNAVNKDQWVSNLGCPQRWKIYDEYFSLLGPKVFDDLGYDSDVIGRAIADSKPNSLRLLMKKSLSGLIN